MLEILAQQRTTQKNVPSAPAATADAAAAAAVGAAGPLPRRPALGAVVEVVAMSSVVFALACPASNASPMSAYY